MTTPNSAPAKFSLAAAPASLPLAQAPPAPSPPPSSSSSSSSSSQSVGVGRFLADHKIIVGVVLAVVVVALLYWLTSKYCTEPDGSEKKEGFCVVANGVKDLIDGVGRLAGWVGANFVWLFALLLGAGAMTFVADIFGKITKGRKERAAKDLEERQQKAIDEEPDPAKKEQLKEDFERKNAQRKAEEAKVGEVKDTPSNLSKMSDSMQCQAWLQDPSTTVGVVEGGGRGALVLFDANGVPLKTGSGHFALPTEDFLKGKIDSLSDTSLVQQIRGSFSSVKNVRLAVGSIDEQADGYKAELLENYNREGGANEPMERFLDEVAAFHEA